MGVLDLGELIACSLGRAARAAGLTFAVAVGCGVAGLGSPAWAQGEAAAPAAQAAPVQAAAPAAAALPGYFGATSADPAKPSWPDPTGGAAGVWATPAGDGKGDTPASLGIPDLYDRIAHNLFSINMVWALIAGFLVMFMQAGFMFVETGLCRAKNAAHTSAMNFMIYPLGCLAFWVYGFAIGWGNWFNGPVPPGWYSSLGPGLATLNSGWGLGAALDAAGHATGVFTYGLIGTEGLLPRTGVDDVSVMALFFFMMVFMDTTATIPTGAMAERWAWKNFCLYGLWVALPYCLYANWVWGGGWLAQGGLNWGLGHGAVDFAGSGVVHAMGGIIGAGRRDRHRAAHRQVRRRQAAGDARPPRADGRARHVHPGLRLVRLQSRLDAGRHRPAHQLRRRQHDAGQHHRRDRGDARPCSAKGLKPDPTMMCNGMLAGLVAITAPCAFVDPWAAALIGAIAGVLVVFSVFFWERARRRRSGRRDLGPRRERPLGRDLGRHLRQRQVRRRLERRGPRRVRGQVRLGRRARAALRRRLAARHAGDRRGVVVVFGFAMAYVWFKLSNLITPLRVSKETELEGLDGPEMGALAYPDFALHSGGRNISG